MNVRVIGIVSAAMIAVALIGLQPGRAGNEANFVLYSHHTEPAGEVEINFYNDFSRGGTDLLRYRAQQIEIEYAFTDKLVAAIYFDGQKSPDDHYEFGAWRAETRYRLFEYGAFLNPVLYVEYENERPQHRYITAVLGRTDTPERPGGPITEHNIETKLILGHDFAKGFDIAFNWINEANLDTGHWEFGYAFGLNYSLYRAAEEAAMQPWQIKSVKLGAELYGGLGDNTLGLTFNHNITQQYAGLNLKGALGNGMTLTVGGAVGLTDVSERALARLQIGYEFK